MQRPNVVFALVLVLGSTVPVSALTTVNTPSLVRRGFSGDSDAVLNSAMCLVLNTGTQPIAGTLTFVNDAGNAEHSESVTVPAGQIAAVHSPDGPSCRLGCSITSPTRGSCRFEGAFSKKSVRLTLCAVPVYWLASGLHEGCASAVTSP